MRYTIKTHPDVQVVDVNTGEIMLMMSHEDYADTDLCIFSGWTFEQENGQSGGGRQGTKICTIMTFDVRRCYRGPVIDKARP